MKLIVKNYGAIKEASIDLSKQLYLFVGYNNTGKTYLTKLIYEIFNPDTLEGFSNSKFNTFSVEGKFELTLTKELIDKRLNDFSNYLKEEIIAKKLFKLGTETSELEKLHIRFEYDIETVKKSELKSSSELSVDDTNAGIVIFNLKKIKKSLDVKIEQLSMDEIFSKLPNAFFDTIPKKIFEEQISSLKNDISKKALVTSLLKLLLQIKEKPFFLPSNRDFILENAAELKRQDDKRKKELSELLLDLMESGDKNREQISNLLIKKSENEHPSYIQELSDEILKLRSSKDEGFISKGTGFYNKLLEKLTKLLGGEIIYEKASSISDSYEKFKLHHGTEKVIKMDLASSSVNQLSPLFLFFKYLAKAKRNFLMIDEPEENLHPQNQILLMNLLMEFIASDNRLLITTHSPLIAEVINNYLVLSQLTNKEEIITERSLPQIDITADNTGIYYFAGEKVFEHKVDKYGALFTSFKFAQDDVYDFGGELRDLMFKQLGREFNKG